MDITPIRSNQTGSLQKFESFEQAKKVRDVHIWQQLDKISVEEAIAHWLMTLSHKTQINYQSGMRKLAEFGLISPSMSLQAFALVNHDTITDQIKLRQE